jgi:hypothetical protein
VGRTAGGDVYAGRDGNVYRNQAGAGSSTTAKGIGATRHRGPRHARQRPRRATSTAPPLGPAAGPTAVGPMTSSIATRNTAGKALSARTTMAATSGAGPAVRARTVVVVEPRHEPGRGRRRKAALTSF